MDPTAAAWPRDSFGSTSGRMELLSAGGTDPGATPHIWHTAWIALLRDVATLGELANATMQCTELGAKLYAVGSAYRGV